MRGINMKRFNELDLVQRSQALKFIEDQLSGFMQDEHIQIYFKNKQNDKQIREHVKVIARNTIFDDSGAVLVEESLRA
jgi:hypothetical protein